MHDRPDPAQQAFLEEVAAFLRAHGPYPVRTDAHRRRCLAALVERGWGGGPPLTPQQTFLLDRALIGAGFPDRNPDASGTGVPLRCRTAELRRMLAAIRQLVGEEEELSRRLHALEVDLAGLEALELRAVFPPGREDRASCGPDEPLLTAVALRANVLGTALADLGIAALGYRALPAPDPHRQHNELPDLLNGGSTPGPDAIATLLRYVGGLDVMGARERLAGLTGSEPQKG
ncbi:MAG: hypothetical protein AB7I04_03530 [Pseudomonadales bacterium]